jgi:hypothetical protein
MFGSAGLISHLIDQYMNFGAAYRREKRDGANG